MPILTDKKIWTGWVRERVFIKKLLGVREIPEPVYNYAVRISKITGLPLEEVLNSQPVRNMLKKFNKKVEVFLGGGDYEFWGRED